MTSTHFWRTDTKTAAVVAPPANTSPDIAGRPRLDNIDLLRGLVMVLIAAIALTMIAGHNLLDASTPRISLRSCNWTANEAAGVLVAHSVGGRMAVGYVMGPVFKLFRCHGGDFCFGPEPRSTLDSSSCEP